MNRLSVLVLISLVGLFFFGGLAPVMAQGEPPLSAAERAGAYQLGITGSRVSRQEGIELLRGRDFLFTFTLEKRQSVTFLLYLARPDGLKLYNFEGSFLEADNQQLRKTLDPGIYYLLVNHNGTRVAWTIEGDTPNTALYWEDQQNLLGFIPANQREHWYKVYFPIEHEVEFFASEDIDVFVYADNNLSTPIASNANSTLLRFTTTGTYTYIKVTGNGSAARYQLDAFRIIQAVAPPEVNLPAPDPALPLSQTHSSREWSMSFRYPAGWVVNEQGVLFASSDRRFSPLMGTPAAGQVGLAFMSPADSQRDLFSYTALSAIGAARQVIEVLPLQSASAVEPAVILGKPAARVTGRYGAEDLIVYTVDFGGGNFAVLIGVIAPGELSRYAATIDAMVASMTYVDFNRAPEVMPMPDQVMRFGAEVDLTVSATDPDGDGLRLSVESSNPAVVEVGPVSSFNFILRGKALGTSRITVRVGDTNNSTTSINFQVTVPKPTLPECYEQRVGASDALVANGPTCRLMLPFYNAFEIPNMLWPVEAVTGYYGQISSAWYCVSNLGDQVTRTALYGDQFCSLTLTGPTGSQAQNRVRVDVAVFTSDATLNNALESIQRLSDCTGFTLATDGAHARCVETIRDGLMEGEIIARQGAAVLRVQFDDVSAFSIDAFERDLLNALRSSFAGMTQEPGIRPEPEPDDDAGSSSPAPGSIPSLDQTFATSDGFLTVDYPANWTASEMPGATHYAVMIHNRPDGAKDTLSSGQVVVWFQSIEGLDILVRPESTALTIAEDIAGQANMPAVPIESMSLWGNRPAARVIVTVDGLDMLFYVVDLNNGAFEIAVATTVAGEMAAFEPIADAIVQSVRLPGDQPTAGHAVPGGTIIEEFDNPAAFTSISGAVGVENGQAIVHFSRAEGDQYLFRMLEQPFSGDMRLTVRGTVKDYTSNCWASTGIGDAPGSGVGVHYGYYGGGCSVDGAFVGGTGVQLDYGESDCSFSGNWQWITLNRPYTSVLTIIDGQAHLEVDGVPVPATGQTHYNGEYGVLWIGHTGSGDDSECTITFDSVTVEPLGVTSESSLAEISEIALENVAFALPTGWHTLPGTGILYFGTSADVLPRVLFGMYDDRQEIAAGQLAGYLLSPGSLRSVLLIVSGMDIETLSFETLAQMLASGEELVFENGYAKFYNSDDPMEIGYLVELEDGQVAALTAIFERGARGRYEPQLDAIAQSLRLTDPAPVMEAENIPAVQSVEVTSRNVLTDTDNRQALWSVAVNDEGQIAAGGAEGTVWVWDGLSGDLLQAFNQNDTYIRAIAFSPNRNWLAWVDEDGEIRIWDDAEKILRQSLSVDFHIEHMAWSHDEGILAIATDDETILLVHTATGEIRQVLDGHRDRVTAAAFSPNDRLLVSSSNDGTVRLWDVSSGEMIRVFQFVDLYHLDVTDVAFSPDGTLIAAVGDYDDSVLRVWDVATGITISDVILPQGGEPLKLAFSRDNLIAVGMGYGTLGIWDARSGKQLASWTGHMSEVLDVAFAPNGTLLASSGRDGAAQLWSIAVDETLAQPASPTDTPTATATSTATETSTPPPSPTGFVASATPEPTSTATATSTATPTPTGVVESATPQPINTPDGGSSPGTGISLGANVAIDSLGGASLTVMAAPSISADLRFTVTDGERFEVIGGPELADGFEWWQLRDPDDPFRVGWMVSEYLQVAEGAASGPSPIQPVPTATATPTATPTATITPTLPALTGGNTILFTSDRDGAAALYTLDLRTGDITRLTEPDSANYLGEYSPDGTQIVYTCAEDICLMNADGSNRRRLTNDPALDMYNSWSPDGRQIAFISKRDGDKHTLWVMNADGSNQRRLISYQQMGNVEVFGPRWSPDGTVIGFQSYSSSTLGDLWTIRPDGSGLTSLKQTGGRDQEMSWSPDGQLIAFTATGRGFGDNKEIFIMNADGSSERRLTDNAITIQDRWPVFSPDGQHLIFHSDRDGKWDIYMMNLDGSGQTNLTRHPANDTVNDWR